MFNEQALMPALGVETSINNKRKIESSLLDEENTSWNQLQLCEYAQPYTQDFPHHGGWIFFYLPLAPELRILIIHGRNIWGRYRWSFLTVFRNKAFKRITRPILLDSKERSFLALVHLSQKCWKRSINMCDTKQQNKK